MQTHAPVNHVRRADTAESGQALPGLWPPLMPASPLIAMDLLQKVCTADNSVISKLLLSVTEGVSQAQLGAVGSVPPGPCSHSQAAAPDPKGAGPASA